jgi:hypothetical protein
VLLPPQRRRSLFDYRIIAAYLAGTCSGALLTAAIAWILSGFTEPLSQGVRAVLLGIGAALIWMCKQGLLSQVISLPESHRQIPAEVFGGSLVRGAYRFGFELGTGMRTYVPSPAPYILILAIILARLTLVNALLVGLGFGLGRAIPLMLQVSATGQQRFSHEFLQGTASVAPTATALLVLVGGLSLV